MLSANLILSTATQLYIVLVCALEIYYFLRWSFGINSENKVHIILPFYDSTDILAHSYANFEFVYK